MKTDDKELRGGDIGYTPANFTGGGFERKLWVEKVVKLSNINGVDQRQMEMKER
ncbi:hypothetical protein BY996DRAFT_6548235 [Phakopsora pachyrhizi]|nr:hypothetical protein BY996DRAFT_6548235 [Phakopsora pachyrhizi]